MARASESFEACNAKEDGKEERRAAWSQPEIFSPTTKAIVLTGSLTQSRLEMPLTRRNVTVGQVPRPPTPPRPTPHEGGRLDGTVR